MILSLLILVVGGAYLYYRYKSVSDKSVFFKSPLFVTLAGSLTILLVAVLFVNLVASRSGDAAYVTVPRDMLDAEESDTTTFHLLSKEPAFHYQRLRKIVRDIGYADLSNHLEARYRYFSLSPDARISSLGKFCLGVIQMERNELDQAYQYFQAVPDQKMPYLHFCIGEILLKQSKNEDAAEEFAIELRHEEGNKTEAFLNLIYIYEGSGDYEKLRDLMHYEEAVTLFPSDLARITLLKTLDFATYPVWLMRTVLRQTNVTAFAAALLIAMMWLIYIFRLDIFNPEKFIFLLLIFVAGTFTVPIVFLFSDYASIATNWSLTGDFFNDFFYAVIMIGIPEEFAKVIPLLILVAWRKSLKEPIDYLIYGAAGALGFAFVENLLYFEHISSGIIHGRAYLSVIGHMTDTSLVAYGFVIARYQLKNAKALWYVLPSSFFTACVVHGIYDFLLFQELIFPFFIFFILTIQIWIIMLNNCMNNTSHFTYRIASRSEKSTIFITLALTSIFAFEYIYVGFSAGAGEANHELFANSAFAGFFIIFFSSNLGSFDLIKGHWRNIKFQHEDKRGYGSRQRHGGLISWYFVNASRSHNYVGQRVKVYSDPHNKILASIMEGEYSGQIVDRIILYEGGAVDPHWFLVKMKRSLPLTAEHSDYILVKLRYQEDSLLYEDEVEVYFKAIPDMQSLRDRTPDKKQFPFYGWAYISLQSRMEIAESTLMYRA